MAVDLGVSSPEHEHRHSALPLVGYRCHHQPHPGLWLLDRRFYRRKYNAAKITAAFSSTLRNEVDLDQLREQLIAVVQETMQPTHVSLWMRQPSRQLPPSKLQGRD